MSRDGRAQGRLLRLALAVPLLVLLSGCCRPCPPCRTPTPARPTPAAVTLTPEQRVAVDWIRRARAAEPTVTPRLQAIAEQEGGELVGLEHKIKTLPSTISKLRRIRAKDPETPLASIEVYDALRYTMLIPDDPPGQHDAGIHDTLQALEAAGLQVRKVKNYWPRGDSYSGTNCTVATADGLPWELQFHTPASYEAKSAVHDDYDRMRSPRTPVEEQRRLFEQMKEMWETVPIPDGVLVPGSLHAVEEIRLLPAP